MILMDERIGRPKIIAAGVFWCTLDSALISFAHATLNVELSFNRYLCSSSNTPRYSSSQGTSELDTNSSNNTLDLSSSYMCKSKHQFKASQLHTCILYKIYRPSFQRPGIALVISRIKPPLPSLTTIPWPFPLAQLLVSTRARDEFVPLSSVMGNKASDLAGAGDYNSVSARSAYISYLVSLTKGNHAICIWKKEWQK